MALKLGLSAFGGPVAHLGYFREVYVERCKWLSEGRYAELVALTQFLPGPGSSQLGAAIGYHRAGWFGGFAAWLGFTLPSALAMIAFAVGLANIQGALGMGWLHGLKLAAIAVVIVATVGMRSKLCPRWPEMLLAVFALIAVTLLPWAWVAPVAILLGGVAGVLMFSSSTELSGNADETGGKLPLRGTVIAAVVMIALLSIPWLAPGNKDLRATGDLLQAGSLVFGGGHVVLPLLEAGTVDQGLVDKSTFLGGYGAAQAV
ncbi:MAG: chromate efflux transporter, partial [Akkermansiaceae bacterium]